MSFNVQCNVSYKNAIFIIWFFSDLHNKIARPKSDNCCRQETAKIRIQKSKKGSCSNYGESQDYYCMATEWKVVFKQSNFIYSLDTDFLEFSLHYRFNKGTIRYSF